MRPIPIYTTRIEIAETDVHGDPPQLAITALFDSSQSRLWPEYGAGGGSLMAAEEKARRES